LLIILNKHRKSEDAPLLSITISLTILITVYRPLFRIVYILPASRLRVFVPFFLFGNPLATRYNNNNICLWVLQVTLGVPTMRIPPLCAMHNALNHWTSPPSGRERKIYRRENSMTIFTATILLYVRIIVSQTEPPARPYPYVAL